ncbi:MAG: LLM class flavin-dependent oxidoreductase [Acidimicrobiaceae bacterium]|nr:LLM class flavin-dependent oxidoreductase [Acidimicrobiaceae bacterium]
MKIRFAVTPPLYGLELDDFGRAVEDLERLGFDTVWLPDITLGAQLDPIVGLAFAAGRTTRLKLGADLVPIGRNPLGLAKDLAQLDRLSGGRLLLSFVSGIDQPGEREVLGIGAANRGRILEEITPLLRAWWSGETVNYHSERWHLPGVASPARPVQDPLEVWFGGHGPKALVRAGHFSDGWLGSTMGPAEAGAARQRILDAARDAGRAIDPEHFGLSVPYAVDAPDPATVERLRARRPDVDVADVVPVGPNGLRDLVHRLVDEGLSKFVVRPTFPGGATTAGLGRLADAVLPLQT